MPKPSARVEAARREFAEEIARGNARYEDSGAAAQRAARLESMAALARAKLIDQYRMFGLEPIFGDSTGEMVISLPMLLKQGWRIEEVNEKPTLVRPFLIRGQKDGDSCEETKRGGER